MAGKARPWGESLPLFPRRVVRMLFVVVVDFFFVFQRYADISAVRPRFTSKVILASCVCYFDGACYCGYDLVLLFCAVGESLFATAGWLAGCCLLFCFVLFSLFVCIVFFLVCFVFVVFFFFFFCALVFCARL